MRRSVPLLACVLLALAPTGVSAQSARFGFGLQPDSLGAGWRQQQNEARDAVQRGRAVPLGRVLENIRRRTPGRQLDAGMENRGGRAVYRVRWAADDGRRIDYIVDAESGAILGANGE